jgi:uncharacterized membrane protein YfcA
MFESLAMTVGVFLVAFMFAPIGMGGGMLFAPLLHYVAGWPIDGTLLAMSLTLTWAVSIGSGLRHRRESYHDDEATKVALSGALLGALLGVAIVNALDDGLDTVFKVLSIVMLVWALVKTKRKIEREQGGREIDELRAQPVDFQTLQLRMGAGIGGALSSVLGVGAGVIYVPVLQQNAGLDARSSIGSSLAIMMMVVPVAILTLLMTSDSGIASALTHQPWWFYALPFAAYFGATSGATFGITKISTENIMKVFMALVAIMLLRYILDVADLML